MNESVGKIGNPVIDQTDTRVTRGDGSSNTGNTFVDAFSRAVERYTESNEKSVPTTATSERSLSTGGTHPNHIPIPGAVVFRGTGAADELNERALRIRSYRQELLAANIANADTPNYKAVDIDVEAALRAGYRRIEEIPLMYREPSQGSVDGNTVELDFERAEFARNAIMYQYAVSKVGGEYKEMQNLLKDLVL